MINLNCRFYRNRYPEENDVVVVCIKSIAEMGAYVDLLEYNNIEGMILLSELSRRRIRSINKLVRVGKNECVVVIRVDKEKGYIDLSKRRVSSEEVKKCEDKYTKARTIASIVRHSAELSGYSTNEELEALMDATVWYFDEKYKSIGGAYEIFRRVLNDPTVLEECNLDKKVAESLITCIQHRMEPKRMKARADIEVSCYKYDGIDAVKAALKCGLNYATESFPIKINLIAPPLYVIMVSILDKNEGLALLETVINAIKDNILAAQGNFSVKLEPKVVTEMEETDLAKHLQNLEQANTEVDGDDDISDTETSSGEEDKDKKM